MLRLIPIILIALLTGCETSAVWYNTHPQKKIVDVDGYKISVVPRRTNEYDAFGGADGTRANSAVVKQRLIKGVELISGCKVKEAEYMPSTYILQTVVTCESK